jgi:ABC-2 type transport system permease protein
MNWRVALAIARKDIVDAFNNKYILFSLIMPIAMSLLLRLAFGGFSNDMSGVGNLNVAVTDPGGSRLVQLIQAMPVNLSIYGSEVDLKANIKGSLVAGIFIPAGFDEAVRNGQQPTLTVYINSIRGGGERAVFWRMIDQAILTLSAKPFPAQYQIQEASSAPSVFTGDFVMTQYFLLMLLVMGLSMTGAFAVPLLLVEEKEKHTLDALLVSPAGPAEVAAGKALTGMLYSLIICFVLMALNQGFAGNVVISTITVLLGALLMVAIGLLMGSLFRTSVQVNTWSSIIMLVLLVPSWLTILPLPKAMQVVFKFIPSYYMVDPLQRSLAGTATLGNVWVNLLILTGCVAATFALVVWRLRREDR